VHCTYFVKPPRSILGPILARFNLVRFFLVTSVGGLDGMVGRCRSLEIIAVQPTIQRHYNVQGFRWVCAAEKMFRKVLPLAVVGVGNGDHLLPLET
jgi:hypothetical protein